MIFGKYKLILNTMDYNKIFSERTKKLSINIINELSEIPYSDKVSVIRKQIFRSSSSSASNYRAMCRARSNNEKFAKICIVVEEADETLFWLEVIEEVNMVKNIEWLNSVKSEATEIVNVTSAYKKRLGEDLKK